jgi:WD40 repeat protein
MTAQTDLDRALGAWFVAEAAAVTPPEPLARVLDTTRLLRPRPAAIAWAGSRWVGAGGIAERRERLGSLRPVVVLALVALLAVALTGAALLVGSRLLPRKSPPRIYVDELISAPDLSIPMAYPTLVSLLDGRVLVIGDDGDGGGTGTRALVYDPATGVSEATGPLVSGESLWMDSAVRLHDGRVLVFGNVDDGNRTQIFDPRTKRFVEVGPFITPRIWATVAVLPDGHVLIAGGIPLGADGATSSAELFDPETGTFSTTGSMTTSRQLASAAVLPDGRVFVAPGESRTTVELYDPRTGAFSQAGTMSDFGFGDAITLPDGRVLVVGGTSLSRRGFTEIWDPQSLTFSPRWELEGRVRSATLLDDGRILMVGGEPSNWLGIFDPTTGRTASTPRFTKAWHPKATRLADGRVLIVGGLLDGQIRPEGGGTLAPGVSTVEVFE